ncbi:MAG: hypothetical protein M3450_11755 [Actinomycetota bacterium]|nr:hypothetical protein [Actinomycetota bacterium]
MNDSSSRSPGPVLRDPADAALLRRVLRDADFTATGVAGRLPAVRAGLRAQDRPLYDRQVPGTDSLSTLIRLFLLGLPVPFDAAEAALAPLEVRRLQEAMILTVADGAVMSRTQLLVVADLRGPGRRDAGDSGLGGRVSDETLT